MNHEIQIELDALKQPSRIDYGLVSRVVSNRLTLPGKAAPVLADTSLTASPGGLHEATDYAS